MPFLSQDEALDLARKFLKTVYQEELPLTLKAQTQNWVFQTTLPDGEQAIVRVRHLRTPSDQASETCESYVLRRLAQDTSLNIPRVIAQKILSHDQTPYEITIFKYMLGSTCAPADLMPDEAARIGSFLAQLHHDTARLIQRADGHPSLDAEGLLGRDSRYASPDEAQFLSASDQTILNRLKQRVADVEAGLDMEHTLLLHGDFLLQNIVLEGSRVGVLDFEMCGYGIDLYDLAPLLWQMKLFPQYEAIADAYWQGYTQVRDLPSRDYMETFIAARQGASVRWLIQNRHLPAYAERVPALIRQRMDEIAAFLETGVLKRN